VLNSYGSTNQGSGGSPLLDKVLLTLLCPGAKLDRRKEQRMAKRSTTGYRLIIVAWLVTACLTSAEVVFVRPAGAALIMSSTSRYLSTPRIPCCGGGGWTYDRAAAVNYANEYVGSTLNGTTGWNSSYTDIWSTMEGDDCTDFVSQAMHAGGMSWIDDNGQNGSEAYASFYNYQSTNEWWVFTNVEDYVYYSEASGPNSNTESVAPMLRTFLINNYASQVGSFYFGSGKNPPNDLPSPMEKGDVLFWNWGTGQGISHTTFDVGIGTSPQGQSGSLIDEHISNRKQTLWTLRDYNNYWPTTTAYWVHIDA
jgi:hypothetical protein